MSNKVLIIASVDSGGGAGITADCQTVHDLGAFPLPCTVAVTSQSLKQVAYVESVSDKAVQSALDLILSDWDETPQAVKVGFIPLESTLNLVLKFLEEKLPQALVVWDPVLTATAGRMESADLKKSLERILKITTIFTPNLPEALELAGWSEEDLEKTFIKQLEAQAYEYLPIHTEQDLINNLRKQLEKLNNYKFEDKEWDAFFKKNIANATDSIADKTYTIQEDYIKLLKKK